MTMISYVEIVPGLKCQSTYNSSLCRRSPGRDALLNLTLPLPLFLFVSQQAAEPFRQCDRGSLRKSLHNALAVCPKSPVCVLKSFRDMGAKKSPKMFPARICPVVFCGELAYIEAVYKSLATLVQSCHFLNTPPSISTTMYCLTPQIILPETSTINQPNHPQNVHPSPYTKTALQIHWLLRLRLFPPRRRRHHQHRSLRAHAPHIHKPQCQSPRQRLRPWCSASHTLGAVSRREGRCGG